ncbi:hypothetical protein JOF57_005244 [Mycolicibacterium lutetiense]|jgi:hypothetical protein|uniref:Intersectin-EH binding protein Ibp1 n=1 Tax=Mycolicibacterium lutetiense TaxID=1641992 RepID=A0ABS5A0Q7_9MYCO|nr:hypothetical protein [Mycolicibacterium lutetiense]
MNCIRLLTVAGSFALGMAFTFAVPAVPAYADPAQACVRPDGTPCPPMPAGCVQENGLPCSGSLPDINAACMQNPVVCRWLTG